MKNFSEQIKNLQPAAVKAACAGLVAGALLVVSARFILLPAPVHYHADFAVYINNEQEQFDSDLYYEEVQSCSGSASPLTRTHLHKPDSTVVHVHDDNVTWGHFFANLGWSLSNNVLQTDTELLAETEDAELRFVLNGNPTRDIANKNISSEDVLLVNYGDSTVDLQERYDSIAVQSAEFNQTADPAACAGSDNGFRSRLIRAIWL